MPLYCPDLVLARSYSFTLTCSRRDNYNWAKLEWDKHVEGHMVGFRLLTSALGFRKLERQTSLTSSADLKHPDLLLNLIQITWCCRGRSHSGRSEAVCCPWWLHENLLPSRWQRTGRVSKWSPTWRGLNPGSRLDILYKPVEGHSTAVVETR